MANFYNKKVCRFCAEKVTDIDYKDVKLLQRSTNIIECASRYRKAGADGGGYR